MANPGEKVKVTAHIFAPDSNAITNGLEPIVEVEYEPELTEDFFTKKEYENYKPDIVASIPMMPGEDGKTYTAIIDTKGFNEGLYYVTVKQSKDFDEGETKELHLLKNGAIRGLKRFLNRLFQS